MENGIMAHMSKTFYPIAFILRRLEGYDLRFTSNAISPSSNTAKRYFGASERKRKNENFFNFKILHFNVKYSDFLAVFDVYLLVRPSEVYRACAQATRRGIG